MDPSHLENLISVEQTYWWHVAKRELVLELLRRHAPSPGLLVEGGVGGGANSLAFRDLGYDVRGFDLMAKAVEYCRGLGLGDVRVHDLQEPWPIEPAVARAVVILDVIEHLPDPVRALRHAARALRPDGAMIVTVPAVPALMGPWDRMLGHYRRYSRRIFQEQAREAGLRVIWLSHWNSFTLPAAVVIRTLERLAGGRRSAEFPLVSRPVNALLIHLARLEQRLMSVVPVPVVLSLVGVLTHERRTQARPQSPERPDCVGRAPRLQRGARPAHPGAERE
jgi:SAM-dependent methyltransferase